MRSFQTVVQAPVSSYASQVPLQRNQPAPAPEPEEEKEENPRGLRRSKRKRK